MVSAWLARLRARLRLQAAIDGLARAALLGVAASAGLMACDWLWHLPRGLRALGLLALLLALGWLLWRRLLRPLGRALPDRELALFVERRCPALDGRLVAASEGLPLDAAERTRLEGILATLSPRSLVPAPGVGRRALLAGLVLLAAAALALAAPGFVRDGARRLFLPFLDHDWQRRSALALRCERAVIAVDEPAIVDIERLYGPPAPLRLSWQGEDGLGGQRQLPGSTGPWRAALDLAPGRWTISAHSGDALPARASVRVVPRPRLDAVRVRLQPPAYTALPAQELTTPPSQALAGSELSIAVALSAAADRRIAGVRVSYAGESLPVLAADGEWRTTLGVRAAGDLVIEAEDEDGITLRPPARFPIALEPDRPPTVSLSGPRSGEAVGARAQLALTIAASDDYGLGELALDVESAAGSRRLFSEETANERSRERRLRLEVAALAGPGTRLALIARARDRNTVSGPGAASSPPLYLQVVDDEELRRDLERQLSEARERVRDARRQLAPGLAEPLRLAAAARAAAQDAARAQDQLAQALRRWRDNQLDAARAAPIAEAQQLLAEQALAALARAAGGDGEAGPAGERALDRVERLLDGLLAEGDLTRLIARLCERQQALLGESRAFVRAHLARQPDDAGRARQRDLAERQRDLAAQGADLARRLRAAQPPAPALRVLDDEDPPGAMAAAAAELASDERRLRALELQQAAVAAWQRILEALSGSDRQGDLGRRLGELAERQERLSESVEQGRLAGAAAEREQTRLRQDSERLQGELAGQAEAQAALQAAIAAQQAAERALAAGQQAAAAQQAALAGSLLRAAQRVVDPRAVRRTPPEAPDVIAALRRLLLLQAKVLADSLPIHARIGEQPPDFAARRELAAIAGLQRDILARLRDEALQPLARAPVAQAALLRVESAMQRVLQHLQLPALGERGISLERRALLELKRVLEIADAVAAALAPAEEGAGGGGGGGGGDQAGLQAAAELAWLIVEQEEILAAQAARRPGLAERQGELARLIAALAEALPPGSRTATLLQRARAMAQATRERLAQASADPASSFPPGLAVSQALRQALAEIRVQVGGSGAPGERRAPPEQEEQATAGAAGGAQPGAASAAAGATGAGGAGGAGQRVHADQQATSLLQLPPLQRERLRQAREQRLPPGALELFERYLERLQEP
ncbi:MAG: DUF4175 domain-containing protein [Planctomycetota bacterium]|nr:DUF4175 domain-containing protein [Planctomycetota bacterium]